MCIALPSLNKELSPILVQRISSIILIYSGALSFNAFYIQSIGSGIGIYSGLFHVSSISQLFDTFLLIIGAFILIPRPGIIEYIRSIRTVNSELTNLDVNLKLNSDSQIVKDVNGSLSTEGSKYSLIILFSTLGSLFLISSSDLLSMYLSIELQSFGLYILATLFRDSKLATSAGLKYFLLGGLSSCLILLGSALVYTYTGLTNLDSLYSLVSVSLDNTTNINQGFTLGFSLIIIGFLFKIAAAPLHNWSPDVYNDSPTIVTIWLTIMPKIGILIFLLEFFIGIISFNMLPVDTVNVTSANLMSGGMWTGEIITNLLLISSLFSLIIGTVVGLAQTKIKRLLAYSTISHIGFILLALSINSEQSIESFLFYIIQYSITNLNTFLIILALGYFINYSGYNSNNVNIENKDIKFISELKGQFNSNPLLSLSLSICLFSMAGIPPLIGFFSKQMVLYSALQSGYYFMAIIAIIVSVISASYYLKIVKTLFTAKTELELANTKRLPLLRLNDESQIIRSSHSFLISTLTLVILLFILKPSLLLNSIQLLSLSLYFC